MLRSHINRIYINNLDMDAIVDAVQPELDHMAQGVQSHFEDIFPVTATADGILNWEIILGIVADPSTEPLDFRRGRILNRLASNVPFTERALQNIMDNIMGPDAWNYNLDYQDYTLDIISMRPGRNWLAEMETVLAKIIPANLIYNLHIYYANWERVLDDYADWGAVYASGKTWQDILEGT